MYWSMKSSKPSRHPSKEHMVLHDLALAAWANPWPRSATLHPLHPSHYVTVGTTKSADGGGRNDFSFVDASRE